MPRQLWIGIALGLLLLAGCPDRDGGVTDDDVADDDTGVGDDDTGVGDDDTDDAVTVQDVFAQSGDPTDVLFVVDNSCSMQEEQQALMDNFGLFISSLQDNGIDYHIGVTVLDDWQTQPPIGQLFGSTRYIEPTTPDVTGAFTANMTMGADGVGSCEVGLEASMRALSEPLLSGYNAGFYREDGRLVIAVISDEVDGSVSGCNAISAADYVTWLASLKVDGLYRVLFVAIVGDQPNGCTSHWGQADPGEGYHDVVAALGPDYSSEHSICQQDWSPVMSEVGAWASAVNLVFGLSELPVEGTLTVWLDLDGAGPEVEFEIPHDPSYLQDYAYAYEPDDNSLVFAMTSAPPVGSVLRAVYEPQP
jgi:hypothetical protein